MKRILRHIVLFLAWLLAGIVVLLVIAGLLIQTRPVKNKLAQVAEKQAAKVLNGDISIGKISGNFFTDLNLEHVLWTMETDTFAYLNSVEASYRLWPLIHGELLVNFVHVDAPFVSLRQSADSTWNVQSLVKESDGGSTDTTSGSGNFKLILSDIRINGGSVKIQSKDTVIPDHVEQLYLEAQGAYSAKEQTFLLKHLGLQTRRPDLNLQDLSFNVLRNEESISLKDFHLKTAQNALEGEAEYSDAPLEITANLESEPINIEEFEFFVPDLKLPAKPVIRFKSEAVGNGIQAKLFVSDQDQKLDFDIFSENLFQFLTNRKETNLKYKFEGTIENIDLAHWLGNPELDHQINGKLEINGIGTDPKTADIDLGADLRDCVFAKKPIDKLTMNLRLSGGNLSGNIDGEGDFGAVSLKPNIRDLQGQPSYDILAVTEKLNLAPLLGNDSLQSNINLRAQLNGESFDPKELKAQANIILAQSSFSDYTVDSLVAQFRYNKQNFEIDSLWARAQTLRLNASGNYNLVGVSDIQLDAFFDSIQAFSEYIPLDSVYGGGSLKAHLWGRQDSLLLNANAELEDIGFSGLSARKLWVKGNGKLIPGDTTFTAQANLEQFRAGNFELDSIYVDADYFIDSVAVNARVAGDQLRTEVNSQIALTDVIKIELSSWNIDFRDQHLELVQSPAIVELDSLEYRVSNLKLASEKSDSAQFIAANGSISRYREEDFELEISNVDVGGMLRSLGQETEVSGKINTKVSIGGTAAAPEIIGDLSVDNAEAYGYRFSDFGGDFTLTNNRLNFEGKITPADSGSFNLQANLPVTAKFDSLDFGLNLKDTISAELLIQRFPLSTVQFINKGEEINGFLEGKVNVGGTLEEPKPTGNISLKNASVGIPEYGIDYENIVLDLNFSENAARLDSFFIKTDDGNLKASGTVDFSSALYKGDVSKSEIAIRFNQFNPFDHRQFNMQLSGDASLRGEAGKVVFDGKLIVPEANIYLPAVMNMTGRFNEPEIPQPLLVREMEMLANPASDTTAVVLDTVQTRDTIDLQYLDGLTGRLTVEFPQNTWIKNKDLFVEISGELELIKNAEFIELFGSIDIVRGQYDLLGKTFKVDEGTITFQGGEELMPRLNIQATYSFRNPEEAEQDLTVNITGTANEPEIKFMLDGSKVSEGDALSFILFGKGMNELTIDQQEDVAGAGQLAGSAAMAVLSSQLTDLLGNKLDVDYIEVKGNGDFDNATVVVGKYITNDLFVSYEQRFGETDEKDIAKYEVKLEYELFKFLFLQLNNSSTDSGFDVIFKLQSK